ncbi:Triosephosphate isomerase [Buchnera aphidicola (Cinara kochiana kochiana)]|uniref:Triosephosphate isomerase n=1 Tax=Buchnera aphidicola (Cinara kochiana kochiana) TaxID=2518976 RepID=A0A451D5P9_9GAMM|nr:triose-phosphate isomerase [Buchnera aphidicola]VFP81113.1 Triosephosphate isomerase [Buchnera aphidicola (Cinara kochiana kochiana)]
MIKPIIVGNWKLNGTQESIKIFLNLLNKFLVNYHEKCTVVISLPILYAYLIRNTLLFDNKNFFLGAQNTDNHNSGSFTGEISPIMLKDLGIKYVIIGHSERRFNHNETNRMIANKFFLLKKENLIPILCIGETKQEKLENNTINICKKQIDSIFDICGIQAFNDSIIAYEPVWAIGSEISATPKEAQFIARFIRQYIVSRTNDRIKNFFIQYGGSVTRKNAKNLIKQKDIDGFLLGRSSLQIEEFTKIIEIIHV